jgi:hypothetical protein
MLWAVPSIEQQGPGFLVLEIVGALVFVYWQSRVAQPGMGP